MKTLISLSCFGDPIYRDMAALCISSLRGAGRHSGDIVLVCDGSWASDGPDSLAQRFGVRAVTFEKPRDRTEMALLRWSLDERIDLASYDRVLFLDVDILAIDDLAPLFEFCARGASATEEYGFNTLTHPAMAPCLTVEELQLHGGRWGINAGAVCFDRAGLREHLALYRQAIRDYLPRAVQFYDQPPFNALILRGQLPFTPFPRRWIDFPSLYRFHGMETVIEPQTKLLHFCGYGKKQSLGEMQLSESLVASVRRGETDEVRRRRLAWLLELRGAKEFHQAQAERWQEDAAFHAQQSRNWQAEAAFHAEQSKNWQAEAALQSAQRARWEAEARRREQEICEGNVR